MKRETTTQQHSNLATATEQTNLNDSKYDMFLFNSLQGGFSSGWLRLTIVHTL